MNNKKSLVYGIIALLVITLAIIGASYAYFQNQYGSASSADVNVTTYTTDVLTFETGDSLSITADQESFAEGKGSISGTSFARATLQANNKTNEATSNYYVYLNISKNEFTYTNTGTPELILTIINKDSGKPVDSITGLNYVTVTDGNNNSISGFDITEASGLLTLLDNKEISASPKTIEEWDITLTLVNYNFDQNTNAGKALSAKLIIQKDKMTEDKSLASYVIKQYNGTEGDNGIYYHDANLTNGAGDNSYRYAGENPNNYICLGSNETTCPDDNLYRIIGVFGEENHGIKEQQLVKVIKKDSMGSVEWNTTSSSDWTNASLNKTLNTTFITEKLSDIEDKIQTITWKISGYNTSVVTIKEFYDAEIKNATKTHQAKIGLMYASDYGFATPQNSWTSYLASSDLAKNNWLYKSDSNQWTLTPDTTYTNSVWFALWSGDVDGGNIGTVSLISAAYPTFYLSSSVKYAEGDGSLDNPIRIN